jgi:hypothetical protein
MTEQRRSKKKKNGERLFPLSFHLLALSFLSVNGQRTTVNGRRPKVNGERLLL